MKQDAFTLPLKLACVLLLSMAPLYSAYAASDEEVQAAREETGDGKERLQAANEAVNGDKSWYTEEYALPEVTVEAKRPNWESKLSPGTVTIIRPSDYKGEQKTLPELLQEVPGVHVRYVSGKGQYTTVTVRGSTAAQVGVFVDGVLSNLGGDAAVDISTIPVKNVERIEVYRGYIPARFGGTYMGGVINIVTKRPEKANISVSTGKGSWGGDTASLEISEPLGSGSLMVGINRDQSDGDFRYKNPGVGPAYARAKGHYEAAIPGLINAANDSFGRYHSGAAFTTLDEVLKAESEIKQGIYWNNINKGKDEAHAIEKMNSMWNNNFYSLYLKNENSLKDPAFKSDTRWRQNNDYKNTDALIKWQDDHWMVKGSWKKIDRGLPQQLPITGAIWDPTIIHIDLPGYFERKRQELTTKDLLVGRREVTGSLEWGWQANYLDQDKAYRNPDHGLNGAAERVMGKWSAYSSRRIGSTLDGTYKAGKHHLLEFMANWSREKMDVDGSRMDKMDMDSGLPNALRFRTYYEQTLFNLQLQDTMTLNQAEDLWLTPGIRYNSSTVMGRAAGAKRDAIDHNHKWVRQEDTQKDDKVTWQMALKKQVNDRLTLRSTYGSYYRLLNLYEIAGDGAGIMPRPNTVKDPVTGKQVITGSLFPVPEEGTQWDVSAIWDGKLLGANSSNLQLTYFGRKSENLLQLYRFGFDYWSYTNTAKGRVNGVELQGNFSWDKWDLNLAGTYMHSKAWDRDDSPTNWGDPNAYIYRPHLYAPEWEGAVRLTYRPDSRTSLFSEMKYVGEMYCWQSMPEHVQSSLTTIGLGAKYKMDKDLQIIAGVNDLLDKGPDTRFTASTNSSGTQQKQNMMVEYPLQGRTYYVTLQYRY